MFPGFRGHNRPIYGVYGDFMIMYPKPYSIYLRGTIGFRVESGCF